MIQLSLVPEASEEFAASADYYESQRRGLGQAFVDEVENTFDRIAEHPTAARVVAGDVRRRLVHRFPFAVIYRVSDDQVVVAAVAHRRRRPGYWHGRI